MSGANGEPRSEASIGGARRSRAQVVEVRGDAEGGDRRDLQGAGVRRDRAGRRRVRLEQARADQRAERERKGRKARASPASRNGAAAGSRRARRSPRRGRRSRRRERAAPRRARSCGSASQSTVPTQSATSVASSQNCGPKALPRVDSRKPAAASAAQGKKANCRRSAIACTAGGSNGRSTGTANVATSCASSAKASQRQALRRSWSKPGQFRRAPGERDGGERDGGAGEQHDQLFIVAAGAMPVTAAKTVSATQSSTSQAAEWSNHGARASRSPLPDGWLRSSSIKPFSLSGTPGRLRGKPEKSARW